MALVAGCHWAVLGAATTAWHASEQPSPASPLVFSSRILAPEPSTAEPLRPTSPPPQRLPAVRPKKAPVAAPEAGAVATPLPLHEPMPSAHEAAPVLVAAGKGDEPVPTTPRTAAVNSLHRTPVLPESVRLLYDIKAEIKRVPISANGELVWSQDGKSYDARLEIRIFLLGSRVQTSKGLIGTQGLEPVRFGDKVRSEVAAHFDRGKGKVSYSANTPDETLQPGAQDQLSIFFQLAGLLAADPERYPAGSSLGFQAVGPRSSETWVFKVTPPETVTLPGGRMRTVHLIKDPVGEYDSRAEVWLAPELDYLPVRIRLTQGNGDVVDQLWRATERPKPSP